MQPRSLLCRCIGLSVVCIVCCVQAQKKVPARIILRVHGIPKYDDISEVPTYKIMPLVLKPGKWSHPLPREKKNFERLPRAPECTDRAETSTNVSGRASCARVLGVLPKSALTKGKVVKSTKNRQTYVYTSRYRRPCFGITLDVRCEPSTHATCQAMPFSCWSCTVGYPVCRRPS